MWSTVQQSGCFSYAPATQTWHACCYASICSRWCVSGLPAGIPHTTSSNSTSSSWTNTMWGVAFTEVLSHDAWTDASIRWSWSCPRRCLASTWVCRLQSGQSLDAVLFNRFARSLTCRHQGTPELHEPTDQELRLWREFGLLPGGRSKTKCGMSDFDIEDGDVHESSSVHLDTLLWLDSASTGKKCQVFSCSLCGPPSIWRYPQLVRMDQWYLPHPYWPGHWSALWEHLGGQSMCEVDTCQIGDWMSCSCTLWNLQCSTLAPSTYRSETTSTAYQFGSLTCPFEIPCWGRPICHA